MLWRFAAAWLVIIGVVSYDVYWTVVNSEVMHLIELNPLGRFLVYRPNGVAVLIAAKTLGVAVAMMLAFVIWQLPRWRSAVMQSSYVVAGLHGLLALVLTVDLARNPSIHADREDRKEIRRFDLTFGSAPFSMTAPPVGSAAKLPGRQDGG